MLRVPHQILTRRQAWVWNILVALAYVVTGKLGQALAMPGTGITAIWPPAGITFVGLFVFGWRIIPGIYVGAFYCGCAGLLAAGADPMTAHCWSAGALMGVGTVLAGYLGSNALRRIMARWPHRRDASQTALLLLLGAASCLLSASIGTLILSSLAQVPWNSFGEVWLTWWLGDTLGIFIFAPLLLVFLAPEPIVARSRHAEAIGLIGLTAAVSSCVFLELFVEGWLVRTEDFILLPFLTWAGLRLGLRHTTMLLTLVSIIVIVGTSEGCGPYARPDLAEAFLRMSASLILTVPTILLIAVTTQERRLLEDRLHATNQDLEQQVVNRTQKLKDANAQLTEEIQRQTDMAADLARLAAIVQSSDDAIITKSVTGVITSWNTGAQKVYGYTPAEALGQPIKILMPPDRINSEDALFDEVCGGKRTVHFESQRRRKDGTNFEAEITAFAIRNPRGEIIGGAKITRDITTRKQVEAAARETQERLQLAVRAANIGYWDSDLVNGTVLYSPEWKSHLGYHAEELPTHSGMWRDFLHPEDRAQAEALVADYVAGRTRTYEAEFRLKHKDGSYRWIHSRGNLFKDATGQPVRLIGCHLDITERKRIDAKLEAFALLGKQLSTTNTMREAALLILQNANRLLEWDCSWLRVRDEAQDQWQDLAVFDLIDGERQEVPTNPESMREPSPIIHRVMESGPQLLLFESETDERNTLRLLGNGRRSLSLMFAPIHQGKRLIGMLSVQRYRPNAYTPADLETLQALADHCGGALERLQTTAALQQSEERWRLVWETAVDGMRLTDATGRIVAANDAFCRMMGRERADLEGQLLCIPYAETERARVLAGYRKCIADRKLPTYKEGAYQLASGQTLWLEISNGFIGASSDQPLVLGVFRDVTARKQTEEALRQNQEQLTLAARAAQIGFWDWDLSTGTVHFSPEWKSQLGLENVPLPGSVETWRELLHPSDRVAATARINDYLAGITPEYAVEFRMQHADGSYRWIYSRGTLLKDAAGQPYRILGCHLDITKRKRNDFQLEAFALLGKQLSAAATVREAARLVVDIAESLFGWDAATLVMFDEKTGLCRPIVMIDLIEGKKTDTRWSHQDEELTPQMRRTVAQGAELVLRPANATTPPQNYQRFGDVQRASASLMFVPVRDSERTVGMLSIQSYQTNAYTPADLNTLQALADHCGGALARIRSREIQRESELGLATAQLQARLGSWELNFQTRKPQWSQGMFALFDRAPAAGALDFAEFIQNVAPADQARVTAAYERIATQGTKENFEFDYRKPDGALRRFAVTLECLNDEQQVPLKAVGVLQDITERHQAEAALRASEQQYAELVNNIDGIVWEADVRTLRMTFVSHQSQRILGYPGNAWTTSATFWQDHIHPDDREATLSYCAARTTRGEDHSFEYRMLAADGRAVWLADFVTVGLDQGRPVTLRGVMVDISPRKQLEFEQARALSLLRTTIEASEDGLLVVARDGQIRVHNQRFVELWQIPPELLGTGKDEALLNYVTNQLAQPEEFLANVKYLYENPEMESFDVLSFRDGRIYERYSRPQRLENEIVGRVWSFREVTERRSNERLVQGQARLLESIAAGRPLAETLAELCRTAENSAPDMICSVLLMDEDGQHLRHGAAPSLPEDYCRLVDGIAIGPKAGSCGTCAYRETTVIVENIATDPLWEDLKHLALPCGLRACWSTPIFNHNRAVVGTLAFYYPAPKRPTPRERRIIEMATHTAAIAILKHRADEQLGRSAQILRQLSGNLLEAQEAERRHLARELHDELGQTLTATKILLENLQTELHLPDRTELGPSFSIRPTALHTAISHVETMLQQVRTLSLSLRPTILDDCGLPAALRWLLDQHTKTTGRPVAFELKQYDGALDPAVETACFRIAQEALTNISRHSHARTVNLELQCDAAHLTLVVRDDGVGFDVTTATRRAHAGGSMGLLGQQERATLLGGRVEIKSRPGAGTEIRVWFPVNLAKSTILS